MCPVPRYCLCVLNGYCMHPCYETPTQWTSRRYAEFQDLENRTWQKRGPMPPFPNVFHWGHGQLSRRVSPVGRVGRLEAKRLMLEAWLRTLFAKVSWSVGRSVGRLDRDTQ